MVLCAGDKVAEIDAGRAVDTRFSAAALSETIESDKSQGLNVLIGAGDGGGVTAADIRQFTARALLFCRVLSLRPRDCPDIQKGEQQSAQTYTQ